MDERWPHSKRPFMWRTGDREKTNRTTPTTLQGRMQARPTGTWHKLGISTDSWEVTATDRDAWRCTVKLGLSQYEETQRVKADDKKLHKKTVCPTTAFTCSKCDRDCHSRIVFTATTDAAKWVQIYGLSRPTDANGDINGHTYSLMK